MDRARFIELIHEAVRDIPPPFAEHLEKIDIVVKRRPSADDLAQADLTPGDSMYGFYRGIPLTERDSAYTMVAPDVIDIYQEPLEEDFPDEADLIEARLVYRESHPGAPEPSQADLVALDLVDDISSIVDLVDGVVVAVPGERCDGVEWTIEWKYRCDADRKTLEVAQEAYRAMNGPETNPTEADLAGEFMRHVSGLYDLVDNEVAPAPDGPCVDL